MRDILRTSLTLPLAILLGCGTGGLEQAELTGECAGELSCGTELDDGPLAVGASVELRASLTSPGTGSPAIALIAADSSVIEARGDQILGVGSGMSAVLITDDRGIVLDFFHVFVELPDHLQVTRVAGTASGADLDGVLELLVGDELTLTTRPSLGSQLLAGSAAATWTAGSEAVSVLRDGDPSRRRLVARAVGDSTLTIESMGLTRTINVNVLP